MNMDNYRGSIAGLAVLLLILLASATVAQGLQVVPTYESLGIYWSPAQGAGDVTCSVRFCEQVALGQWGPWRQGLDLWFDGRAGDFVPPSYHQNQYRGSLVGLKPDTSYKIELTLDDPAGTSVIAFGSTWPEETPSTAIRPVRSREFPLHITDGGTAASYKTYEPLGTYVVNMHNDMLGDNLPDTYCIKIDAPYVIVKNFNLVGGEHSIILTENAHHVVIEGCDISYWGNHAYGEWGHECAGILIHDGWDAPDSDPSLHTITNVVIQRNRIHDPRWDTNSWCEYNPASIWDPEHLHPYGPVAIKMVNVGGNNVIRYNEIYSDGGNYFADCIGGGSNFSYWGCPGRDTDVYQNWISHCWDDGIEAEGGNVNVRIWGNYIDHTRVMVACLSTSIGPLYVFRNVTDLSHYCQDSPDAGSFMKVGNKVYNGNWGDGRVYVFNNTTLQDDIAPVGIGGGMGSHTLANFVLRNNVIESRSSSHGALLFPDPALGGLPNDFDYDLLNGYARSYNGSGYDDIIDLEPCGYYHIWHEDYQPVYTGTGFTRPVRDPAAPGTYTLDDSGAHPGADHGDFIPNFCDGYTGSAPDIGAHENGWAPMTVGISATSPTPPASVNLLLRQDQNGYDSHGDARISDMPGYTDKLSGDSINCYVRNRWQTQYDYRYQYLHQFDVSAIPAGATITAATFDVFHRADTDGDPSAIVLNEVLHPWNEAFVCWDEYDDGLTWNVPSEVDLSVPLDYWTQDAVSEADRYIRFDLTDLVQAWVDGTADPDAGFVMIEYGNEFHEFHTSEALDRRSRPRLAVTYTLPAVKGGTGGEVELAGERTPLAALAPNTPNPFNPSTTIRFAVGDGGGLAVDVRLEVFDVRGQRVAVLRDEPLGPGEYAVEWSGRDDAGRPVRSGVYFSRLSVGGEVQTGKMTLVK